MRAVWATAYGAPDVLVVRETPNPRPNPDDVVVEVHSAVLSFVDTQIRAGTDQWHERRPLPYIPGEAVSGRVVTLGSDVDPVWLNRRVIADVGIGGLADQVIAKVADLIEIPKGVGLAEAAAVYTDGSTALGLIEGAEIRPGEWVLVEAAAGGVGTLLVQLAKSAGARVIGAARGARKLDLIRSLGADAVVDYSQTDWARAVRTLTGGIGANVIFDGVGGHIGRDAFEALAPGGRFSIHGASSGSVTEPDADDLVSRGVKLLPIDQLFGFRDQMRRRTQQVLADAAHGQIRPVIGQTFPLEGAADAHTGIEARSFLGKTLIQPTR